MDADDHRSFSGAVEVDETQFCGNGRQMGNAKFEAFTGRGPVGKTAVVGARDPATNKVANKVVRSTGKERLEGFAKDHADSEATVYADKASAYDSVPFQHEAVKHSFSEHVRGKARANGVESFWSMMKRGHVGTSHKIRPEHLNRYVQEFAGKHNVRDADTLAQMTTLVAGLVRNRLICRNLAAPNGLPSGARA